MLSSIAEFSAEIQDSEQHFGFTDNILKNHAYFWQRKVFRGMIEQIDRLSLAFIHDVNLERFRRRGSPCQKIASFVAGISGVTAHPDELDAVVIA